MVKISKKLEEILPKEKLKVFTGTYCIAHPSRAVIIEYLKKEEKASTEQIAKELGFSKDLIDFHLLILARDGFIVGEFGPTQNPKRFVKYYQLIPNKVEETIDKFVEYLR